MIILELFLICYKRIKVINKKVSYLLTNEYLTNYAVHFLQDNFNLELSIPIMRNNRLRTTLGRYVMTKRGEPLKIDLSGNLLNYGTEETILGVLKHECVHYAFHVQGKNFRDGNPEFEATLKRLNAPSTETLKVGKFYVFLCNECKKEGETKVKRLVHKPHEYRSLCCHGKIEVIGERIYRGN